MSTSLIQTALKSATDTKDIVFGHGVLDQMGPMFARLFPGKEVLVVADENTFAAAGEGVVQSLKDAGVPFAQEPYVFPGTPTLYAGYENVENPARVHPTSRERHRVLDCLGNPERHRQASLR